MRVSIEIDELIKSYETKLVLNQVSIRTFRNNITALVGPNGAGKTTLIKSIVGSTIRDSGQIYINGLNADFGENEFRKLIGYIPEDTNLLPESVRGDKFIQYIGKLKGLSSQESKSEQELICKKIMANKFMSKTIEQMSSGMKQAVAIAQGFIGYPEVILADEPTVHLDPTIKRAVFDLFMEFKEKKDNSILICSHILPEIENIADNINIIQDGIILYSGKLRDFLMSNEFDFALKANKIDSLAKVLQKDLNYFGIERIKISSSSMLIKTSDSESFFKNLPSALVKNHSSIYELKSVTFSLEERFFQALKSNTKKES